MRKELGTVGGATWQWVPGGLEKGGEKEEDKGCAVPQRRGQGAMIK